MWKILSNQKQEKVILLNHTRRGWKWKKNFSAIFCYLNIVAIASLFLFIYYYFFHIRYCYIFCEIAHISGRWMFVIYVVVVSICQQKKNGKKEKKFSVQFGSVIIIFDFAFAATLFVVFCLLYRKYYGFSFIFIYAFALYRTLFRIFFYSSVHFYHFFEKKLESEKKTSKIYINKW